MKEHMRAAEHKLTNVIPLTIEPCESTGDRMEYASETSDRFVQAARQLPSGGLLGLQISVDHSGKPALAAFSGTEICVSKEDYEWIFQNCAAVDAEGTVLPDAFHEEGRRVYALQRGSKRQKREQRSPYWYVDDDNTKETRHYTDMLAEIWRTGAEIRILSHAFFKGSGMILFSLQDEMTLRMRAMVSRAFSTSSAIELKEPDDKIDLLPVECLTNALNGLLKELMRWPTYQSSLTKHGPKTRPDKWHSRDSEDDEEDYDELDDFDDEETVSIPDVSIEALDLSIRALNALKRAGIDTISSLRSMSHEDLMHVRNLGSRCLDEIENKLRLIESTEACKLPQAERPAPDYADMLEKLIGLQSVKEQVRRITAFARMNQDMERQGKDAVPVVLNMAFSGNPGTAKTTVARIIAGLFHEIGLLSSAEVIEVGRADLVAKYTGQTAPQVKSVFQKAKGKLLFIDEAYSLVDEWNGSYGDEAINTIVQEMENGRENIIVVFAGYPDKMEEFLSRNPGLRSRVPFHISFPDYSADEMVRIAQLEAEKRGFSISPAALEKVMHLCMAAAKNPETGNGRYCRNLIEDAILSYALRVYGKNDESPAADYVLSGEDFSFSEPTQPEKQTRQIGFAVG